MALQIASLNSGSNGNCYYVGNEQGGVLIDAGISCREIERRMTRLGLEMAKLKAVFISHEHTDHISGVAMLSKKYRLPVYITPGTLRRSRLPTVPSLIVSLTGFETIKVAGLEIVAFPKFHDAEDPHSFVVSGNGASVGVFTDIGVACQQVVKYFRQCNAVFLEANYDVAMLETGGYPFHLKQRIRGGKGHLSNDEALRLFKHERPDGLSHLILCHLSKNNNNPALVEGLFAPEAGNTRVIVASRDQESGLYEIYGDSGTKLMAPPIQLSMF